MIAYKYAYISMIAYKITPKTMFAYIRSYQCTKPPTDEKLDLNSRAQSTLYQTGQTDRQTSSTLYPLVFTWDNNPSGIIYLDPAATSGTVRAASPSQITIMMLHA